MIPAGLYARRLGPSDAPPLDQFLVRQPVAYLYPLGWLRRDGIRPESPHLFFHYVGCWRESKLVGAALVAGRVLVALATHDENAARALANALVASREPFHVVVGPAAAVDAFWSVFVTAGLRARLERPQVLLSVTASQLRAVPARGLRLAHGTDLEQLLQATLDMHAHETMEAPRVSEIPTFRRTIEYQVSMRRLYVISRGQPPSLCFKASISAECDLGAQIEGVFVPEHLRGQGHGIRGMSELCGWLLETVDTISLYVNEDNQRALNLYDKLGFQRLEPFKTVFLRRPPD